MSAAAYLHSVAQTVERVSIAARTDDDGEHRVTLWMSAPGGVAVGAVGMTREQAGKVAALLARAAEGTDDGEAVTL